MIVVDTSALLAILQKESAATLCLEALQAADRVAISAGTAAEALIVATGRGMGKSMAYMIEDLDFEVVAVTLATSKLVPEAYGRYGKGIHPAGLNFGDCFAYALAKELDCPLVYIGNDFSKTDVAAAL